MSGYGYLSSAVGDWTKGESTTSFTLGKVVDTNDPHQMGRVRVRCAAWSDSLTTKIKDLPFAVPVSPLAGVTTFGKRGATQNEVDGPVAYGMWNIPKIGSYVLVGCLDGDQNKRFYIGGIMPHLVTHTLPHGRYIWSEDDGYGLPDGPLATNEQPIEPLYTNVEHQFTFRSYNYEPKGTDQTKPRYNLEYRTRGADMQAAAINNRHVSDPVDGPGSEIADHLPGEKVIITQEDGSIREVLSSGYGQDQMEPNDVYPSTGGVNYDSLNYSWTTPGFHAISMNDRHDNCRIRVRTTAGNQIILDDTNERIYVSTAGGESWIEIDQVGNIDIYASKNVSMHAGGDMNFIADKSIRMKATEGIHLDTDGDFRIHATKDISVRSEQNIRACSHGSLYLESEEGNVNIVAVGGELRLSSTNRMSLKTSEFISGDAEEVHWNSAHARSATPANEIHANFPTRVPEHEPWPRGFMKQDESDVTISDKQPKYELEYEYTSALVGRGGRGDTYSRNKFWKR